MSRPLKNLAVLLLSLVTIVRAEDSDGVNMCDLTNACFCDTGIVPIQISCDSLLLKSLYEDVDWNVTLNAINVDANRSLDVSFDNNRLEHIPRFPSLKIVILSFHRNQISEISRSAFADLTSLESLTLTYNNLTADSLFEGVFFGPFNGSEDGGYFPLPMKHLNLSHNKIHSLNKDLLDHLTSLQTLDLSHNPLKTLSGGTSQTIGSLRKLEFLGLGHTGLSSLPEGMLHDLQSLAALDLSGNKFISVPQELRFTHSLTFLNLDGNKFETLDKESFQGLESLVDLSIRHINTLRTIEEETFGCLRNLTKLDVSFNRRLDEIHDSAFRGLVDTNHTDDWPIKELYLNDNGLTHVDQALAAWQYIDYINIQNNPFRCDCNLDWMVTILVARIRETTPTETLDLTCAEPKEMKGKSLQSLAIEPEIFSRCKSGSDSLSPEDYANLNQSPYMTAGVTILVIGILLIIVGVSILSFLVVKRRAIARDLMSSSQIRYERAETDDGEFGDIRRQPDVHRPSGLNSIYK